MAYRSIGGASEMVDLNDELRALAARGRSRLQREEACAAQKARRREEREEQREAARRAKEARRERQARQDRLGHSCGRLGWLGSRGFFYYYYGFSIYLIPAALTWLVASLLGASVHAGLWSTFFWGALPVVTLPVTRRLTARAVEREQAWIAGLPFELDGQLQTLSLDLSRLTVTARLDFQRGAPGWELLRDLLAAEGLLSGADHAEPPELKPGDRSLTLRAPAGGLGLALENGGYRRWVHGLVALAQRLHPLHPVARIHISAQRD